MLPSTSSPLHLRHALFSTTLTFPLLTQSLTIFSFPPALPPSSPPPSPPFFPPRSLLKMLASFHPAQSCRFILVLCLLAQQSVHGGCHPPLTLSLRPPPSFHFPLAWIIFFLVISSFLFWSLLPSRSVSSSLGRLLHPLPFYLPPRRVCPSVSPPPVI